MAISKLSKWLGAGIVVSALSVGGLGLAQQPDVPPGDPAAQPVGAEPAPAPAPEVGDDNLQQTTTKRAEVPAAQMTVNADGYVVKMREVLRRIVQLQGIARRQKDVIKLNCVNDKLLQVKQLVNIGEANKTNLEEAIARDDESGRYDFYSNITIANDQVQTLGAEAEQCIGQDLSFIGPTETVLEGGDEPDDPTADDDGDFPEVEPVPVSSPFI